LDGDLRVVAGLIEGPHVREDEARQFAGSHLLKDATPELANETVERRTSEGEERQNDVDSPVVRPVGR